MVKKGGVSAEKRVTDRVHPEMFSAHERVSYSTASAAAVRVSSSSGKA